VDIFDKVVAIAWLFRDMRVGNQQQNGDTQMPVVVLFESDVKPASRGEVRAPPAYMRLNVSKDAAYWA
jgi:hypothetical protein